MMDASVLGWVVWGIGLGMSFAGGYLVATRPALGLVLIPTGVLVSAAGVQL